MFNLETCTETGTAGTFGTYIVPKLILGKSTEPKLFLGTEISIETFLRTERTET